MVAGGSCSLVAEQWDSMPEAPGSIPGGSTFLSCSFAISEVFGRKWHMIQRSMIRPGLIGLQTRIIGVPSFNNLYLLQLTSHIGILALLTLLTSSDPWRVMGWQGFTSRGSEKVAPPYNQHCSNGYLEE